MSLGAFGLGTIEDGFLTEFGRLYGVCLGLDMVSLLCECGGGGLNPFSLCNNLCAFSGIYLGFGVYVREAGASVR